MASPLGTLRGALAVVPLPSQADPSPFSIVIPLGIVHLIYPQTIAASGNRLMSAAISATMKGQAQIFVSAKVRFSKSLTPER